jgi:hypothetical protein
MSSYTIIWPEEFKKNVLDFSEYTISEALAIQLCAWGNVFMQYPPPENFFEVMDAASKISGAFTPEQCRARCDVILAHLKNSSPNREDEDEN